jgi:ATP-dependent DNA ligase
VRRRPILVCMPAFIPPCLPSPADRPPSGSTWIHEIKHDGYRLMARRDLVGIRLITRRGNDWTTRFPLIVEAVNHLKVRSCLIDGEAVCDANGLAVFHVLRRRRNEPQAFLYAFDLLELNGADLRREPIEVRKSTLASMPETRPFAASSVDAVPSVWMPGGLVRTTPCNDQKNRTSSGKPLRSYMRPISHSPLNTLQSTLSL